MIEPLVAFIIREPGMAERIVVTHVADGHGRCARCVRHDRPSSTYPCVILSHALEALAIAVRDGRG